MVHKKKTKLLLIHHYKKNNNNKKCFGLFRLTYKISNKIYYDKKSAFLKTNNNKRLKNTFS